MCEIGSSNLSSGTPTLLQDGAQLAARAVFGSVFRLVADSPLFAHPVHNLIISNMAGPQAQLYFLGCEVEAIIRSARCSMAAG
jgi:hypothetical protein